MNWKRSSWYARFTLNSSISWSLVFFSPEDRPPRLCWSAASASTFFALPVADLAGRSHCCSTTSPRLGPTALILLTSWSLNLAFGTTLDPFLPPCIRVKSLGSEERLGLYRRLHLDCRSPRSSRRPRSWARRSAEDAAGSVGSERSSESLSPVPSSRLPWITRRVFPSEALQSASSCPSLRRSNQNPSLSASMLTFLSTMPPTSEATSSAWDWYRCTTWSCTNWRISEGSKDLCSCSARLGCRFSRASTKASASSPASRLSSSTWPLDSGLGLAQNPGLLLALAVTPLRSRPGRQHGPHPPGCAARRGVDPAR
mmetsp:Transcript_9292/g.33343  ORF Transcript_9292/g.33343 Transcript_9292/m.33343 type:complete len:313 (-) Transcript_9292:97-1035(-)